MSDTDFDTLFDDKIGKNTAVSGVTSIEDYSDGVLASGETLIKAGERV